MITLEQKPLKISRDPGRSRRADESWSTLVRECFLDSGSEATQFEDCLSGLNRGRYLSEGRALAEGLPTTESRAKLVAKSLRWNGADEGFRLCYGVSAVAVVLSMVLFFVYLNYLPAESYVPGLKWFDDKGKWKESLRMEEPLTRSRSNSTRLEAEGFSQGRGLPSGGMDPESNVASVSPAILIRNVLTDHGDPLWRNAFASAGEGVLHPRDPSLGPAVPHLVSRPGSGQGPKRESSGLTAPDVDTSIGAGAPSDVANQLRSLDLELKQYKLILDLINSRPGVFGGFLPETHMPRTSLLKRFQSRIVELEIKKKAVAARFYPQSKEIRAIGREIKGIREAMKEYIGENLVFLEQRKRTLIADKEKPARKVKRDSPRGSRREAGASKNGAVDTSSTDARHDRSPVRKLSVEEKPWLKRIVEPAAGLASGTASVVRGLVLKARKTFASFPFACFPEDAGGSDRGGPFQGGSQTKKRSESVGDRCEASGYAPRQEARQRSEGSENRSESAVREMSARPPLQDAITTTVLESFRGLAGWNPAERGTAPRKEVSDQSEITFENHYKRFNQVQG